MRIEADRIEITSGLRLGVTLGSPIGFRIVNRDYPNWALVMSPEPPAQTAPPEALPERMRPRTTPRPGHADLAGALKYGQEDLRNVLERASARETAARVAAGAFPRQLLEHFGVEFASHVVQLGLARLELDADFDTIVKRAFLSDVRCIDEQSAARMRAEVDRAREEGDTLGGVVEYRVRNLPAGLGRYSQAQSRLSSRLAAALMSIPAVKGVEIGDGMGLASRRGSQAHDEILFDSKSASQDRRFGFRRRTNRSGGLEGGMTTGEELVLRLAAKPLSTLMQPLGSVDMLTGESKPAMIERSDVCAVPAYTVIGEMLLAWELADCLLEKFGCDTVAEMEANLNSYLKRRHP